MRSVPVADVVEKLVALAFLATGMLWGDSQMVPNHFSPFDGTTPAMNQPGSPADAYRMSSVETMNLATGQLNIVIPLADLMGRGNAKQTLIFHRESQWLAQGYTTLYNCNYGGGGVVCQTALNFAVSFGRWSAKGPTLAQGALLKRTSGDWCMSVQPGNYVSTYWSNTLTRMAFMAPDGTEYEFRDTLTGGVPVLTGRTNGTSRGANWAAYDGSGAILTTANVLDPPRSGCEPGQGYYGGGTVTLRDGTKYTIGNGGLVSLIEDRNGNKLDLSGLDQTYGWGTVTDGLGRQVTINNNTITYPGANGTRTVSVSYDSIHNHMARDPNNPGQNYSPSIPFGNLLIQSPCNDTSYPCQWNSTATLYTAGATDTTVPSQVNLANGQNYRFLYDSWGNVAELHLPTGGYYRYIWAMYTGGGGNGMMPSHNYHPYVVEKDVFLHDTDTTNPVERILYSASADGSGLAGHVIYKDGGGITVGSEDHSFVNPGLGVNFLSTDYNGWSQGKELSARFYDADGTLLRSESTTWEQQPCTMDYGTCFFLNGQDPDYGPRAGVNDPSAPPHHPRVQQKSEVLSGGNQTHTATSLDKFFYNDTVDTFNNVIEKDEYPYNNSTTPWRKTFTAYNAGSSYTQNSVHLISLPVSEKVTDSGGTVKALTCYNYDEYSQTPLQGPTGMRLHDDSFYGTSNGTRGNVTTVKQWLSGATTCPNLGTALSTAYGYDIAGNIVSMLDPRTVKRAWGYADSLTNYAFPTSVTSYTGLNGGGTAFQASLTWDYNVGKPLSTTDLNNNTSNYTYADSLERLTYVTKPDSGRTSICYTDTPGSVSVTSKVAQDSGAASGCGPDQPSNASVITTVSYDGLGRKASTNVASGTMVTNFVYDGRGRAAYTSLAATGNPPSESSHCISNGEVAADGLCTPQYGTLTRFDGISRPVAVIEPGGATTTSQYIADQTLITDPQGAAKLHTADRFGNLVGVVEDPSSWNGGTLSGTLAYPTTYTFDVLNNLTAVSQSSSRGRSFTYDPVKRLLTAQNPESGTITYTYDASGNLATRVDANAKTTTYNATAYDGLNRIKQKTYSDGTTPAVTYCYDAAPVSGVCQSTPAAGFKGRLTGVINSNSWTVFNSFDPVGRVWTSTQTTGGVAYGPFSYTYKYTGALATETYPSGFVATNSFDSAGRMIGVANGSTALVSNVAYDPTGPVSGLTLGNGVIEAWTFGTAQKQPTQLIASAQQQPGIDPSYKVYDTWTWGYNPDSTNNGNISGAGITKTDWTGAVYASTGQTFGYDKVNRLTSSSESGTQVWSRGYVYDAWGNGCVTGNSGLVPNSFTPPATGNPPVCSNYSDGTNRLYIQNSTYNAAGDQTVIGGYTNAYDAENQVKTSTIGGATTTYLYDGGGRRVQKVTGGTTTIYVYDAAGELAAEYTSAAAQASACGNCYLTADTLGSTRMVTDETGMPRECHDFLPFGEEIPRTSGCYAVSTSNTLKFTGKERDVETGNDYIGARYLASAQMRWTIPDWAARGEPVPYANLADPQTLNLFGYVRNNPLARADLDGHDQMQGPTPDTVCMVYAGCRFLTQMQNPRGDQNQAQQAAQDQGKTREAKLRPGPAPTKPDGKPKPPNIKPPLDVNGNPTNWISKPGSGPKPGVRWVPDGKVPSPDGKGGRPQVVWDPEDGYWTHDDGAGRRTHWDPDTGQQVVKAAAIGTIAAGTGALIWNLIETYGFYAAGAAAF